MYIIPSTGLYQAMDKRETIRNWTFLGKLAVSYLFKNFLWLSKPTVDHSAGGSLALVPIRFPERLHAPVLQKYIYNYTPRH